MGTSSRRYLAVWMSRLPTDRIAKTYAPDKPLVVAAPVKSALRLSAVNDAAAKLGLRVGMPLADARAMFPRINVADADEPADLALLEAIADWCDRYTPLVGLDAPDGLMLDISGCAHLFGGEAALCGDLVQRLGARGLQARVAVADTVGCAWGVARYSSLPRIIPSGDERHTLTPLPHAALRLDTGTLEALAKVGLKHIADVLDLPRAPLAARFGQSFVRRLDQALGIEDEPITPRLPVPAAMAEQRFAEPIAREEDVLGTIERLAARLATVLEQRGEGARLLQVVLFRADGKVFRVEAGTGAPLREPQRIAKLFAERLDVIADEIDPGFGFDMVRLGALVTERHDPAQTGLAAPDHTAELTHLIDRLGARFGQRRVTRLVPQDTHIPEFAALAVGAGFLRSTGFFAHARASGHPELRTGSSLSRGRAVLQLAPRPEYTPQDSTAPTRPMRLFERPEPISAIAEVPDGSPARFIWRQANHIVVQAEGPERIAMEWWRDENGHALMRDYFRVESEEGLRVWLFHEWSRNLDRQIRWYVHGVFA